jgi:predicted nucleic acid-binding protein
VRRDHDRVHGCVVDQLVAAAKRASSHQCADASRPVPIDVGNRAGHGVRHRRAQLSRMIGAHHAQPDYAYVHLRRNSALRSFDRPCPADDMTRLQRLSPPTYKAAAPPNLARVTRYVIDAATLVHIVTNAVPVDRTHQIVAPNALRSQAMSLLLAAVRRGELSDKEALKHHAQLTELKIRLLGDRVSRQTAWRIARERNWETLTEAEYVAVTKLQADALITVDDDLAAKARGIVALASLDDLSVPSQ